ncbi:MAG: shikimate dehydrogenase [Rhodospirillales bacterium]|nr:shikimate dehydrogenase [Rhodospirillales bacterium]
MNGNQKHIKAGVIGWPIGHSRSPLIHRYWLEKYNLDGGYEALAVRPEDLEQTLRGLAGQGFAGVNITIPHKEAALAIVDEADEAARRIGAVNTIVVGETGRLSGRNTDGFGFITHLRETLPDWRSDSGHGVVLGAGGAVRAVAVALVDAGMERIVITNRTAEKAQHIAANLGKKVEVVPWGDRAEALAGAGLLVNGTSLGMVGNPALELSLDRLPLGAAVYDIVYAPLKTALLAAAQARGNPVVDGLGMLIHQARPAFKAWFGTMPEASVELRNLLLADIGGDPA